MNIKLARKYTSVFFSLSADWYKFHHICSVWKCKFYRTKKNLYSCFECSLNDPLSELPKCFSWLTQSGLFSCMHILGSWSKGQEAYLLDVVDKEGSGIGQVSVPHLLLNPDCKEDKFMVHAFSLGMMGGALVIKCLGSISAKFLLYNSDNSDLSPQTGKIWEANWSLEDSVLLQHIAVLPPYSTFSSKVGIPHPFLWFTFLFFSYTRDEGFT